MDDLVHVKDLEQLEAIIQDSLIVMAESAFAVGESLEMINDLLLWEESGDYASFNAYCKERWGFSRQRAWQLIRASQTKRLLSSMVNVDPPENERICREVYKVGDENRQADLWVMVNNSLNGERVTAAKVREVRKESFDGQAPTKAGQTNREKLQKAKTDLDKIMDRLTELHKKYKHNDGSWKTVMSSYGKLYRAIQALLASKAQ